MNSGLFIFGSLETVLWATALSKLLHLRRTPTDLPLRAITACLVCTALAPFFSLPPVRTTLDGWVAGLDKLLLNVVTLAATYWLTAFFRYSVHGPDARRAVRLQLIPLFATQAVLVGAWVLAPPPVRTSPASLDNGQDIHATVFVLAALGYMGYGLALALRSSLAYARAISGSHLRNGLRIVAAALTALSCACGIKFLLALTQAVLRPPPEPRILNAVYVTLTLVGSLLLATGITYPAATGAAARWRMLRQRRRVFKELEPLWQKLRKAFPHLILPAHTAAPRAAPWWPWTHRAYYRRVIEIHDGIVQLTPYYDAETAARADESGGAAGLSGSVLDLHIQAALTIDALRRQAEDRPAEQPSPAPALGGSDLQSDAQWLVRLNQAMRKLYEDEDSSPPVSSSTSSIRNT
ncbi:MAB_1171c family putative transporter [Streptomyces sp. NPDC101151]|uniref:MAB_1171c family putative transporter n=1 Tax=Streptomyces sp. NPDC101151 TaxID=3366115 RepID=UPI0037FC92EB